MRFDGKWINAEEYTKDPLCSTLYYPKFPTLVCRETAKEAEEYIKEKMDWWEEFQKREKEKEEFKKLTHPTKYHRTGSCSIAPETR